MHLDRIDLFRYTVPLRRPLTLRHGVLEQRDGVLLRLTTASGHVGWGEAAPLPGFSSESLAEAVEAARALAASMQGRVVTPDWLRPEGLFRHELDEQRLPSSVRYAFELAVAELLAAERGQLVSDVVAEAYGTTPQATVHLNALMTGDEDDLAGAARRMEEAGFRAVKLKVGRRPLEQEVERIRRVRGALGPGVSLRVDANRSWNLEEARVLGEGLASCDVEYVEEPLDEPAQLVDLVQRSGLPVALDETLCEIPVDGLQQFDQVARAIVLKPTLAGGLVRALRLARLGAELGMQPVVSATFEAGVGLRGLVALAAAVGEAPAGLDTYRHLADDVLTPCLDWPEDHIDVKALLGTPCSLNDAVAESV